MQSGTPSSLSEIDEVAVLDLGGLGVNAYNFDAKSADARSFTVKGDLAKQIAELFRALPAGDQARCHTPRLPCG
jgi:hypothetical protein